MNYLYEDFLNLKQFNIIGKNVPQCILTNLRKEFPLREYQKEVFCWFDYFLKSNFANKQTPPYHLLFNMATGSGKTLVMAGLILYLYKKGYRNFLFFVNSTTIIEKTKDNFLNTVSKKYLFANKIMFNSQEIKIKEIDNFDEADKENINIKFTTIQKLHDDLKITKENGLSYEDFENKKIVLIADEADMMNAATSNQLELFKATWENTVENILKINSNNILLDFTATMDFNNQNIAEKFKNKTLYKYDLTQFRKDGYSKEIELLQTDADINYRIVQALILNIYRQALAASQGVNLKPVILFKSKTIAESNRNESDFHTLIDNLQLNAIDEVDNNTNKIAILSNAFKFFRTNNISNNDIVNRIKTFFREENCINANNDKDVEKNQILLNSLEDENNPIRAIFAVDKLNRGWDVLNLFDIVRMYETRDAGKEGKIGSATRSEAQLIGRGARYYPFKIDDTQEKYKRKYDEENTELKALETLYYHSAANSRYISELKQALVQAGIMDKEYKILHLTIKDSFTKTELYKTGKIILNQRRECPERINKRVSQLNCKNIDYRIMTKRSSLSNAMENNYTPSEITLPFDVVNIKVRDIPLNVSRYALTTDKFYRFDRLKRSYPELKSADDFLTNDEYLGNFTIIMQGKKQKEDITNEEYLKAMQELLKKVKEELQNDITSYEVSEFNIQKPISEIFKKDKELKMQKINEDAEKFVENKQWYAYKQWYGTSEEKEFINMFERKYEDLKAKYKEIYLLRNELFFKIFDDSGKAFEPDFVLYIGNKENEMPTLCQIFIEPKGDHLIDKDKWKEEFMKQIKQDNITLGKYKVTAVPKFYTKSKENEFETEFENLLGI